MIMEKTITKMYVYWLQNEYPTTIVADRYGGTYSNGVWLAFPLDGIPPEVDGGDIECMEFWQNYKDPVGKGNTPDNALDNLRLQIMQRIEKEVFVDIKKPFRTLWKTRPRK